MPNDIQKLLDLPDISFIDNLQVEELLQDMITDYESEYYSLTGQKKVLYPFDEDRIKLQCVALKLYQILQYTDKTGKMNLLKYATGTFLEHLGALKGIYRKSAKYASVLVRFNLSDIRSDVSPIYQNTRVTAGDNIFFAVEEYSEIPAGILYIDVNVICLTSGSAGNVYVAGQINTLVDALPYVNSVANISNPSGGEDIEDDDSLRERIYLAPSSYSTAGPDDAYVYWCKYFSSQIADVRPLTTSPGQVDVFMLLKNGILPDASFITAIESFFVVNKNIKPNTDKLVFHAPDVVIYNIDIVYYMNTSDSDIVATINANVNAAIEEYKIWQKQVIGRDINPSRLVSLLMAAGVKRPVVNYPIYTALPKTSIATENTVSVVFGGLEDD